MNCPQCAAAIDKAHINIMTDVAQCQQCGHVFKVSENLEQNIPDTFKLVEPPGGTWIVRDADKVTIGATTRSAFAFFLVPFMVVWSGGSLGGIYGTQIISGKFDVFLSLFGIPFILGSILFWSLALMAIWGKVELTLDKLGGQVFTGLGKIGITKKFTWEEVSSVKENVSYTKYPGSQGASIALEGKRRITFARGVNESRRYYLYRALQDIFTKAKSNRSFLQPW